MNHVFAIPKSCTHKYINKFNIKVLRLGQRAFTSVIVCTVVKFHIFYCKYRNTDISIKLDKHINFALNVISNRRMVLWIFPHDQKECKTSCYGESMLS